MELIFLFVILFLFMLAVFDLYVGVSNDAVNFLNSAIGAKAAPFKIVLIVAAVGVFLGAAMSNGMMDIARHGIFRPEQFSFYELLCIFMAVMVTDISCSTSSTASACQIHHRFHGVRTSRSHLRRIGHQDVERRIRTGLRRPLNTEKALSVIIGIFLSVAIAFVFGTLIQFISRMIFTFNYRKHLKWNIGIFGGLCATAIVYFLLIKGMKDLTFMTSELKDQIHDIPSPSSSAVWSFHPHHAASPHPEGERAEVVVLMGTFALAMAFAGNDLINFIGVPLKATTPTENTSPMAEATPPASRWASSTSLPTPTCSSSSQRCHHGVLARHI
jgi:phosphate/sulfate permease